MESLEKFALEDIRLKVDAKDKYEAIKKASEILIDQGKITESYVEEIYQVLEKLGAYFVITPGIAFAHSKPSESVLETSISIMTLNKPVVFGNEVNDPVEIVCVIASKNSTDHLDGLKKMVNFLSSTENLDLLKKSETCEDKTKIISILNNMEG